ncbi:hypothetical protein M436DRAFT_71632 [Aureobasidium namibiae CBS 147.97]|uniref:Extracellular membrane protein CFEM domain-containing protein n=1 Tax=Aureobasidium namibiae CBS 147.97 TaxID=1043004 RepID=A0A074WZI4_9PEZI
MHFTTAIVAMFSTLVLADFHHNCGCDIRGSYRVDVSQATCQLWSTNQPNCHFDGYSCVDKGIGRGIDGAPWEKTCKEAWQIDFGGNPDDAKGHCWH